MSRGDTSLIGMSPVSKNKCVSKNMKKLLLQACITTFHKAKNLKLSNDNLFHGRIYNLFQYYFKKMNKSYKFFHLPEVPSRWSQYPCQYPENHSQQISKEKVWKYIYWMEITNVRKFRTCSDRSRLKEGRILSSSVAPGLGEKRTVSRDFQYIHLNSFM